MQEQMKQLTEDVSEIKATLKSFISEADNRYASKKVESIMWAGGAIIGTAILATILDNILRH